MHYLIPYLGAHNHILSLCAFGNENSPVAYAIKYMEPAGQMLIYEYIKQ